MGDMLLPKKLLAIRHFLELTQAQIADSLQTRIPPHRFRTYIIKPNSISKYETGHSKPNLLILLAYAYLGRVHMELIADDRFTLHELRDHLGKDKLRFQ